MVKTSNLELLLFVKRYNYDVIIFHDDVIKKMEHQKQTKNMVFYCARLDP